MSNISSEIVDAELATRSGELRIEVESSLTTTWILVQARLVGEYLKFKSLDEEFDEFDGKINVNLVKKIKKNYQHENFPLSFEIILPDRDYLFRCHSKEEVDGWVADIINSSSDGELKRFKSVHFGGSSSNHEFSEPKDSSQTDDNEVCIRSGNLRMEFESSLTTSWILVHARLTGEDCLKFKSLEEEYNDFKGTIRVNRCKEIEKYYKHENYPLSFRLILPNRSYRFRCMSKEELDGWIQDIRNALSGLKRFKSEHVTSKDGVNKRKKKKKKGKNGANDCCTML